MKKCKSIVVASITLFACAAQAKHVLQIDFDMGEHRLVNNIKIEQRAQLQSPADKASRLQNADNERAFLSYLAADTHYIVYIDDPRIVGTPVTANRKNDFVSMDKGSYIVTIPHTGIDIDSLNVTLPEVTVNDTQTLASQVIKIKVH